MAQIRGNTQILDASINLGKLNTDFLNGSDWDITNGANDALITGLKNPVNNHDATNKQYVDGLIQGIQGQFVARVKAQSNVASLTGAQTIDGVALVDGDNILLADQTTSSEDGLYTVRTGIWERVSGWEIGDGVGAFFVFIEEGSDDNKGFVCTNDKGSDVIGTNDLTFVQFSSAGAVNAGAGLVQNGSDFDVVAANLSLIVNANDMAVNIGSTNGDSLEVTASGLELRTTITGVRTFDSSTAGDFTITAGSNDVSIAGGNVGFNDSEVQAATTTTDIPLAVTATVDYGNGNGTTAGDVIDQFRADFTDDGIVNALVELKGDITTNTLTVGNGLTNNSGTIDVGDTSTDTIQWQFQNNKSLLISSENYVGANDFSMDAQFYAGDTSTDPSITFSTMENSGMGDLSSILIRTDRLYMSYKFTGIELKDSVSNGSTGGILEGGVNNWSLDTSPDGTVNLAVATVAYVNSSVGSVAADNGLTNNSGTIELGGQLNQDTLIDVNYHDFTVHGNRDLVGYTENVYFGLAASGELSNFEVQLTQNFSVNADQFLVSGATNFTSGTTINSWTIGIDPDGTVSKAIATVNYVDNKVSAANNRKYNNTTTLSIGSQTATLASAPTNGFANGVIYLNGVRQILTTDYTVTNATTGEITFTAAQVLTSGDIVIMDYSDQ